MEIRDNMQQPVTRDTFIRPVGHVRAYWVDKTGVRIPVFEKHNTVLYPASDVIANLYGGLVKPPNQIGFVYGNTDDGITIPDGPDATLATIQEAVSGIGGILLYPFSYSPSFSKSSDHYSSNVVTFHGRSEIGSGTPYIYAAVLVVSSDVDTAVGVVSMDSGNSYPQKPAEFEMALDWAITFVSDEADTPSGV